MAIDLQKPYDLNTFKDFFNGGAFLPDDFAPADEAISLPVSDGRIKSATLLGNSPKLELSIYEVRHESENDPRVTLSRETFRLMCKYGVSRALVLFTSTKSKNYRLSLATIDFKLDGAKVSKEYSNPRRYSFFLGPDAKTHTPKQFLLDKGRVTDFDDLLKRFSIEVVNKEFYDAVALAFTKLVGGKRKIGSRMHDFELPLLKLPSTVEHIKMQEFAVRLIGRLVFCWFLKKKHSDSGVPLIPEELLSSKAVEDCGNDSYYHLKLENLFFQVLNTAPEDRHAEFNQPPYKQIPFLNGGLFEPHEDDHYGGMDRVEYRLKIPNEWFKKLFEILETYNFTIDENTTVDVELAVDPEMLGRIFENLLAEINPETGETARKSTGSYYTPRQIVEYMVDESLRQYLKTKTGLADEKLSDLLSYAKETASLSEKEQDSVISALDGVKVIDPACGSGAFPMGVLQKIVLILQKVDPDSEKWLSRLLDSVPDATAREMLRKKLSDEPGLNNYTRKLGVIRNSIYGVDIQPIAVEISKLRFFLSLVVDEKINERKHNRGIEPLPNLEFKFVCANTLIGLPAEQSELFEDIRDIDRLKNLRDTYFTSSSARKLKVENDFLTTQKKMLMRSLGWGKPDTKAMKLSEWEPFANKPVSWFDPDWMFGIQDGFDIVIANPPYVRQEDIKEFKLAFKAQYECFTGTADLYVYFYERGFQLLKEGGTLTFISSNKYFRSGYGEKLRAFMAGKGNIHQLIDFGDAPVFTAIAYPSIIVVSKALPGMESNPAAGQVRVFSWNPADPVEEFVSRFQANSFLMPQAELKPDGWRLESPEVLNLLAKLRRSGQPLGEYVKGRFYYGIKTGLNEAFVVDRTTRDRLIAEHKSSAEVLKPFLRGRDVKRWHTEFAEKYLIKIESSENKKHPWSDKDEKEAEKIFAKTYPAIHAHMDKFREGLINRDDQGNYFWELRSCAYWQEFAQPKIVYPNICDRNTFAWDESAFYTNQKAFIIPNATRYLLAVLNSFVVSWLFSKLLAKLQGEFYEPSSIFMKDFPIPHCGNPKPIEAIANKILAAKRANPAADVSALEHEIDQQVYNLYNLTSSEIAIIEGRQDSKTLARAENLAQTMMQQAIEQFQKRRSIDIKQIAISNGISIVQDDSMSKTRACFEDSSFTIRVKDPQDRFSIAHEMGHIALHPQYVMQYPVGRKDEMSLPKDKEDEANQFAGEFLMPEDFINNYAQESGLSKTMPITKQAILNKMARFFDVSSFAMQMRLLKLGYKVFVQ